MFIGQFRCIEGDGKAYRAWLLNGPRNKPCFLVRSVSAFIGGKIVWPFFLDFQSASISVHRRKNGFDFVLCDVPIRGGELT